MAPVVRSAEAESQVALALQSAQLVALAMQQVDPFHGNPSVPPASFLRQLRAAFLTMGPKSDSQKVDLAISRLKSKANAWIQPYLTRDPPPPWLSNFDLFAEELTNRFKGPQRLYNVSAPLRSLKQTGSVVDYANEFQSLAAGLGWPDEPLMDFFYCGLKHAVRDEFIGRTPPTNLESFIQMAIHIENHLQEKVWEEPRVLRSTHPPPRKFQPRDQAAPPTTPSRSANPTTARDSNARSQARTTAQPRFGQLSDQEKEYRRKNNLCMYCGSPGHAVHTCPLCPSNRQGPTRTFGATVTAAPNLQENSQAQLQ
jgi:hypothetical protein